MSDMNATPGPWRYTGNDDALCLVRGADGAALASVCLADDARLICRAVNCHADLLAACRLARGVLYAAWNSNDDMGETNEAYLALRAVDAAVAKATGVEATHE